ncbi:MAG TPA: shikimate dehydrogenase [Pyrinomonadaceae bacterium]|nr:shikimate dehydrogenase [Pyrinomonadaceae bacterium]
MRVCVPVCAKSFAEMEEACARASEVGDVIELRLDCVEGDWTTWTTQLEPLIRKQSRPLILTYRPSEQGGHRVLSRAQREAFWNGDWSPSRTALADIESDLVISGSFSSLNWRRVIVSHHDFRGVPEDVEQIYERLAATRAHVVKIAVQAKEITDCIRVFRLLERARNEGRNLIAIAMGDAGVATRILGPARGSFLTYGSLEDESATAPGQVNARQLRSVYRIDDINDDTMICGLVGLPVMHSVSPHMHNAAFAAEGVNGVYLPLEVRNIESFIARMVHPRRRELDWNLRGLSVTAPHKSTVMEWLDWIEPEAQEIGAVNTIVVEGDKLRGYNTDVQGMIEPLRKRVGSLNGLSVAVIGAGGAARAAVWALKKEQARVALFARTRPKVEALGREFDLTFEPVQDASFRDYDVVINTTPVGSAELVGRTIARAEQLGGAKLVYDLIYNPIETEFLKQAREAGCETLGGLEMLATQAELQFQLWTGKSPATSLMYDAGLAALSVPL